MISFSWTEKNENEQKEEQKPQRPLKVEEEQRQPRVRVYQLGMQRSWQAEQCVRCWRTKNQSVGALPGFAAATQATQKRKDAVCKCPSASPTLGTRHSSFSLSSSLPSIVLCPGSGSSQHCTYPAETDSWPRASLGKHPAGALSPCSHCYRSSETCMGTQNGEAHPRQFGVLPPAGCIHSCCGESWKPPRQLPQALLGGHAELSCDLGRRACNAGRKPSGR